MAFGTTAGFVNTPEKHGFVLIYDHLWVRITDISAIDLNRHKIWCRGIETPFPTTLDFLKRVLTALEQSLVVAPILPPAE